MKKILKRLCLLSLAVLTCLMSIGIIKSEKASAETSTQDLLVAQTLLAHQDEDVDVSDTTAVQLYPKADDNFYFQTGCKLNLIDVYEGIEPFSTLRFGVVMTNEDMLSLEDRDTAYATFTLYRSGETGIKPLYRVMIFHAWNLIGMAHSYISGDGESGVISMQNSLHVAPSQKVGDAIIDPNDDESWIQVLGKTHALYGSEKKQIDAFLDGFRDNNYILDFLTVRGEKGNANQPIIFDEVDGKLYLYFDVTLNSYDATYFTTFNYSYDICSAGIQESGAIKSEERSIGQILIKMQANGSFETEIPERLHAQAQSIIDSVLGKELVTVEYLEQIGDSPFAKKVTEQVTVPVLNKTLKKDDVELQIGKNTDCMGAFLESFAYNESRDVYESTYCTSSIGYIKNVTGDMTAIPLSINQSYLSFYHPFIQAGCVTEAEASYIWNTALSNHKEDLAPYSDRKDEVYGLWGYALVPDGYTASDIWANILAKNTAYDSVWPTYTSTAEIDIKTYNQLLGDYHQNFWVRTWNTLSSWFSGDVARATHVFFYADARESKAVISGNGSTDINNTNSLLMNEAQETAKAISDGLVNAAKDVGNNIKNSSFVQGLKTFLKIIVYGLATVLVVWLILKIAPFMTRAVVGATGGTPPEKEKIKKKKKK